MNPGLAETFKTIHSQNQEDCHKVFVLGCSTSQQSILEDESDRGRRRVKKCSWQVKDNLIFVVGECVGEEKSPPPLFPTALKMVDLCAKHDSFASIYSHKHAFSSG